MKQVVVFSVFIIISLSLFSIDYFSQGSLNVNLTTSWRDNGGNNPPNFSTPGNRFIVQSGHNMTASGQWTVSGTNSYVIVQTGGRITTGPYNHQITGTVQNGGTYEVTHNTYSNLGWGGNGLLETNSNFIINYSGSSFSFNDNVSYGNLIVQSGEANCRGNTDGFEVKGELLVTGSGIFSGGLTEDQTLSIANIRVQNGYFYGSEGSGVVIFNISGNLTVNGGYFFGTESTGACIYNIGGNLTIGGGFFYGCFRSSGDLASSYFYVSGDFSKTGGNYYAVNRAAVGYPTYYMSGTGKNIGLGDVPNSYQARHIFYIQNGASYTLTNHLPFDQAMVSIVYGSLDASTYQIKSLGSSCTHSVVGTLLTQNTSGLCWGTGTTYSSTNSPTVNLGPNSTVNYNASATQAITGRSDYRNLILTNGQKNLPGDAAVLTQLTVNGVLDINTGTTLNLAGALSASQIIQGQGTLYIGGLSAQLQLTQCDIQQITLDRANGCLMVAPVTVNTLNLYNGTFSIGSQTLTLTGQIYYIAGNLVGGATSNLNVTGSSSALALPSSLNRLNAFTLNRSSGCNLQGNLGVTSPTLSSGTLNVSAYTLTFYGGLTLDGGALGTSTSSGLSVQAGTVNLTLPSLSAGTLTMNRAGYQCLLGSFTSLGTVSLQAGTLAIGAGQLYVTSSFIYSGGTLQGGESSTLVLTSTVGSATIPSVVLNQYSQDCTATVQLAGSMNVNTINLAKGTLDLGPYSLFVYQGFQQGVITPNTGVITGNGSSGLYLVSTSEALWQLPPFTVGMLSLDLGGGCRLTEPGLVLSGLNLINGFLNPGDNLEISGGSIITRMAGFLTQAPTLGQSLTLRYMASNDSGYEMPEGQGYIAAIQVFGAGITVNVGHDVYVSQRVEVMPESVIDLGTYTMYCEPITRFLGFGSVFGRVEMDIGNMGLDAVPLGLNILPGAMIGNFAVSHFPQAQHLYTLSGIERTWQLEGMPEDVVHISFIWPYQADNEIVWSPLNLAYVYRQNDGVWQQTGDPQDVSIFNPRVISVIISEFSAWTVAPYDDGPLPVVLSSFTAIPTQANYVQLNWITQSETGMIGFRLLRHCEPVLSQALDLNILIPASNTSTSQYYQYTDTEVVGPATYHYWLQAVDLDGSVYYSAPVSVALLGSSGEVQPPVTCLPFVTLYPNPFNPSLNIDLIQSEDGTVRVEIYDLRGRRVRILEDGFHRQGFVRLAWDARDETGRECPSGIYLLRFLAPGQDQWRKVVLTK